MLVLNGISANPGIVDGYVFVADSEDVNPNDMHDGDILVMQYASPIFYELFLKASGIVTELGGITCHAATIARELNIPCIVSVPSAKTQLSTGLFITLDGSKGNIYVKNDR